MAVRAARGRVQHLGEGSTQVAAASRTGLQAAWGHEQHGGTSAKQHAGACSMKQTVPAFGLVSALTSELTGWAV